jgi:ABC-type multidrug transport system ATPase subunit
VCSAFLKDAPVVLLDEPTAALDTESEVAVQQAVRALVRGRTVVVIAHRLSTVVGADQIVVVDDGAVVQRGTHDELLAQQGRYAAMWTAQSRARRWAPAGGGVRTADEVPDHQPPPTHPLCADATRRRGARAGSGRMSRSTH